MRQETIVRTILKFSELDKVQQAKVLDNMRYTDVDHNWYQHVYEDQTTILGILGFTNVQINFSGFSSQGDGASFTGTFDIPTTKKELNARLKALRAYAPKFKVPEYKLLTFDKEEKEYGSLSSYRTTHHYVHYNTVRTDNESLTVFVREFSKMLYRTLEKEYDYLTSDESIKESIECNDYEFYEDTLGIA